MWLRSVLEHVTPSLASESGIVNTTDYTIRCYYAGAGRRRQMSKNLLFFKQVNKICQCNKNISTSFYLNLSIFPKMNVYILKQERIRQITALE